jgi:arginine N-succinyltransferase
MSALTLRAASAEDLPLLGTWLGLQPHLPAAPGEHFWVAVSAAGAARACLKLVPNIGAWVPRVSYHVGCTVHAAPELSLYHRQRTLLLGHDLTGASELTDIGWAKDCTATELETALRALVYAAVHQVSLDRALHGDTLVVELPGLRNADGSSPFWQGLGRHFYSGSPQDDAASLGLIWRSHVAALLPRHPLLASFLPQTAQDAIAQSAGSVSALHHVLQAAGMRYAHHINIEDGGPILEARIDDLLAQRSMRA